MKRKVIVEIDSDDRLCNSCKFLRYHSECTAFTNRKGHPYELERDDQYNPLRCRKCKESEKKLII